MHSGLHRIADEFQSGQLSRRELLWKARGFVGGTALASFLAACGGGADVSTSDTSGGATNGPATATSAPGGALPSQPPKPTSTGTPKKGGTFTFPIIADPVLNPLIRSGVQSVFPNKVIFSGLTRPEPGTLLPTPELAESWEPNEEFTEWDFVLRSDVTWHDGEPFSADDVVFTYDRRINEEGISAAFKELESVKKVDENTVRFILSEPLSFLPTLLSYNQQIVPKHVLAGTKIVENTEFSKEHPIGTGSYIVDEFSAGNFVSLKKNPDFFRGEPYIDRYVFKVLPDINTQVAQLRTGELSFATIEPINVETLQNAGNLTIQPIDYVNHYYIAFQCDQQQLLHSSRDLFADKTMRLAMAHAIDRQAIVDRVTLGYGTVATGTIPTALGWAYNDELEPIPFDPDKSHELFKEAGWTPDSDGILQKDGEPLTFTLSVDKGNPAREQTATIVQQMLKDIGCDVSLETMDWGSFSQERWLAENYDSMHMWWITPPDPDQVEFYGCDGDNNHPNFCNKQMTDLLREGRQTADTDKRKELYFKYQEMELDDPPVSVLYYPKEIRVFPKTLQNVPNIGIRDVMIYGHTLWFEE